MKDETKDSGVLFTTALFGPLPDANGLKGKPLKQKSLAKEVSFSSEEVAPHAETLEKKRKKSKFILCWCGVLTKNYPPPDAGGRVSASL